MFQGKEHGAELSGGPAELIAEQFMRVVEKRNSLETGEDHAGGKRVEIVGMVEGGGTTPDLPQGLPRKPGDPAKDPQFPWPDPEWHGAWCRRRRSHPAAHCQLRARGKQPLEPS